MLIQKYIFMFSFITCATLYANHNVRLNPTDRRDQEILERAGVVIRGAGPLNIRVGIPSREHARVSMEIDAEAEEKKNNESKEN